MIPSLQKLHKFIKLEAERGYDNRAIVGGLDRILDWWELEARNEGLSEEMIQLIQLRLRDYPRLSETSRADALRGLWNRLQREVGAAEITELSTSPSPSPLQMISTAADKGTEPNGGEQESLDELPRLHRRGKPIVSPAETPAALDAPVSVLSGVGPRHAHTLGRLGLVTLRDMLYYFPRRYDDYSKLTPINRLAFGQVVTVIGTVQNFGARKIRGGEKQIVEAIIHDGSGAIRVTWFNPYIARRLHSGMQISISGKVEQYLGRLVMSNPEWEALDQQMLSTNRIAPVYPLSGQITQQWMRKMMYSVVSHWAPRLSDHLPESVLESANLLDLPTALLQLHFPDSAESLHAARHRVSFDELFLLQLGFLQQKRAWQDLSATVFDTPDEWLEAQINRLPYSLTGAQQRALQDLRRDLSSGRPMNRLLQGDVGSGKTVVAALGINMVARHAGQTALMAPTSILAEQHYNGLTHLLTEQGGPLSAGQIRLLIGATPESEKQEIREGLISGEVLLVIGTHALIEEPVVFKNLELAVIDEQHRFGVEQRAALRGKGANPHLLVMTATPIPRSLALTVYGDLDLSVMDEMPPGRQEIGTFILMPKERERAYRLIRSQIQAGRQAFIIYPLVEEGEKSDSLAAVEEHSRLQTAVFPDLHLGLLHGRLRPEEKDEVMRRFRANECQLLVSTSVVEVGVDVPNATVMLIEGADRFGLAQLHQFRGRVGRGSEKSYCLLIPNEADAVENERLQAMAESNDGFVLAEKDLQQRGPGDFLGTRQSGLSALQLASLTDVRTIEKAQRHAQALFEQDPDLQQPANISLSGVLKRFWESGRGDIS